MAYYRLYFMSPRDGHIERFLEIEAVDDTHAIRSAKMAAGQQPLELWCGSRKVQRFEASSIQMAAVAAADGLAPQELGRTG